MLFILNMDLTLADMTILDPGSMAGLKPHDV